jgi:Flp pilus assembly protein TadD
MEPFLKSKKEIPAKVPGRARFGAAAVMLCLLSFIAYANGLHNGWVWDDNQQIVMNPDLRGASIRRLLTSDVWSFKHPGELGRINYYRPMQMLTYRLVEEIFGLDPLAFHAVSLSFHVLAVLLAFLMFCRLTGKLAVAFAAAALFAVHPVHAEAVDWISALPDIAGTVFLLFAFLLFHITQDNKDEGGDARHARARSRHKHLAAWGLSCVAMATALLWKETAVVFPVFVAAYVLVLSKASDFRTRLSLAARLSFPYWCILGAYVLLRLRVLGFLTTNQRAWSLSPFNFALTILHLLLEYWWKLIAPFALNAYYVFSPVRGLGDPRALAAICFIVLAAAGIWIALRRAPLVAYSALWVFIALLPVLNIYWVGLNVLTERYLYLPSVGFCLLVVLLAASLRDKIPGRGRWLAAILSLLPVLIAFTWQTVTRNPDWRDDSTFFARALETSPNAPFVHNMFAMLQRNDPSAQKLAEDHYLQAITLAENESPPNYLEMVLAYEGLAPIYAARSEFDRALETLDQVRRIDPNDPEVDADEGFILARAGRWDGAEIALQKAAAIAPNNENVLNALGLLYWQHYNRLDDAANYFLRAIQIHTAADRFSASLHNNLAAVYGSQGRTEEAIQQLQTAVRIAPDDPEFRTHLGMALALVGRSDEARSELLAALALAPGYGPARAALQQLPPNSK